MAQVPPIEKLDAALSSLKSCRYVCQLWVAPSCLLHFFRSQIRNRVVAATSEEERNDRLHGYGRGLHVRYIPSFIQHSKYYSLSHCISAADTYVYPRITLRKLVIWQAWITCGYYHWAGIK